MEQATTNIMSAAERPSIIKYFSIEGLYGYRSVSLNSKYAATVLIAKNGAGKTTLLGALDAFLKGQYGRLADLDFKRIECHLHDVAEPLILEKSDLDGITDIADSPEFLHAAKLSSVEPIELAHFVTGEYEHVKQNSRDLFDHPIFNKVFMQPRYNIKSARDLFDDLQSKAIAQNTRLAHTHKRLRAALLGYEIVYLPTYRRIELSLPEIEDQKTGRRQTIQSRLGLNRRSLHSGDIQFGLADISRRLEQINQDMLTESNQGYREISANIIDDLINGAFEREVPSLEERPSKEALNLFFSRLKQGRKLWGYPNSYSDYQIPDVERILREDSIPENSRKFLTYFLGKLNKVMQKTRDVESVVEEFVRYCNRYLSSQDDSVIIDKNASRALTDDSKVLTLDRKDLAVTVSSVVGGRSVPLDALSSGEKQMISLFARLYLWPGKKIVLFDEPELSLSIDWQRKILLDVISAKECEQVIAITHSPFVFDNELEPFAREMRLRIDPVSETDISKGEDTFHG